MIEQRSTDDVDAAHEADLGHCVEFLKRTLSSQGLDRTHLSIPLSRITETEVAAKLDERSNPRDPSPFPVIFAFTECLYEALEVHFTADTVCLLPRVFDLILDSD